jgi:hypothetical protein
VELASYLRIEERQLLRRGFRRGRGRVIPGTHSKEEKMPVWFFVVLAAVLVVAVLLAIRTARIGRSAYGQDTTIIDRELSSGENTTTVVESD